MISFILTLSVGMKNANLMIVKVNEKYPCIIEVIHEQAHFVYQ